MRIAIDLDGVCYEWQRTYRYMMREYRGVDMPPIEDFWYDWDAPDKYTSEADREWLWTEGVRLGLFRYGHVTTGAIVGLRALIDRGHDLLVVTHRPSVAVPDTLAWLSYINIPWSEIHILSRGESKAQVDAKVLVDDKPANIYDWNEKNPSRRAIIYNRPWNKQCLAGFRAYDWRMVVQWVDKI